MLRRVFDVITYDQLERHLGLLRGGDCNAVCERALQRVGDGRVIFKSNNLKL